MPFRISRAMVGVLKDTTLGTFVEPAAADSFYARDISLPDPPDPIRHADTRLHFGKRDNNPNPGGIVEIGFKVDLVGGSAAGTAGYLGPLFLSCGMREEDNGSTDITYKPWSTFDAATGGTTPTYKNPYAGSSVAVWEDGPRYALKGANGNCIIRGSRGGIVEAEFRFMGAYEAVADDATPPSGVNVSSIASLNFANVPLSVHTVTTLNYEGFEFDFGNQIVPLVDAKTANVEYATWIINRTATLRLLGVDMVAVATLDLYGKQRSQATGALTLGNIGATAGNKFQLSIGRCQIVKVTPNQRDGGRTVDVTIEPKTTTSGAEGTDFSLIWT